MTITYRPTQEALEPGGNLVPVTYVLVDNTEFGRLLGPTNCGSVLLQPVGHYHEVASHQFSSLAQAKEAICKAVLEEAVAEQLRRIAANN